MVLLHEGKLTYSKLKELSERRIKEAEILLKLRQYSGAYYLAGYSVELALKAYYAKGCTRYQFPPIKAIYNKLYTHDLNKLLDVSGLKSDYDAASATDPDLMVSWGIVKEWNEHSRYEIIKPQDAKALISAIVDSPSGILTWIKTKW